LLFFFYISYLLSTFFFYVGKTIQIIGLILGSPDFKQKNTTAQKPTIKFDSLPPLASPEEAKNYQSHFLSFLGTGTATKPAKKKQKVNTENDSDEFTDVDVSPYLIQIHATLGISSSSLLTLYSILSLLLLLSFASCSPFKYNFLIN
jgi:hypothetical protein